MNPKKLYKLLPLCFFPLFFISSCCTSGGNLFVLLSDPDGKTGKISVSNKGGSRLLTEPRQATEIKKADESPTPPFLMEEKQIQKIFGPALNAQPDTSVHMLLFFEGGSSDLTKESKETLLEILNIIKTRHSTDVSIIGHTDRVGSRDSNFELAIKRAALVKEILAANGLDAQIFEVASHGEDNPMIKTEDEIPEPRNRRVEVVIR